MWYIDVVVWVEHHDCTVVNDREVLDAVSKGTMCKQPPAVSCLFRAIDPCRRAVPCRALPCRHPNFTLRVYLLLPARQWDADTMQVSRRVKVRKRFADLLKGTTTFARPRFRKRKFSSRGAKSESITNMDRAMMLSLRGSFARNAMNLRWRWRNLRFWNISK